MLTKVVVVVLLLLLPVRAAEWGAEQNASTNSSGNCFEYKGKLGSATICEYVIDGVNEKTIETTTTSWCMQLNNIPCKSTYECASSGKFFVDCRNVKGLPTRTDGKCWSYDCDGNCLPDLTSPVHFEDGVNAGTNGCSKIAYGCVNYYDYDVKECYWTVLFGDGTNVSLYSSGSSIGMVACSAKNSADGKPCTSCKAGSGVCAALPTKNVNYNCSNLSLDPCARNNCTKCIGKAPTPPSPPTKAPTKAPTPMKAPTKAPTPMKAPTKAPAPTPTKAPVPAPTPTKAPTTPCKGLFCNFCFSGDSTVQTKVHGNKALKNLMTGEDVLVADGTYEPVYTFGHYSFSQEALYLQVYTTKTNTSSENYTPLEITPDHMILKEDGRIVPASSLKVGDHLVAANGEFARVENIREIRKTGVFAPFTPSGTIVVNGLIASTYISFQKDSGVLVVGDVLTPVTFQWLSHIGTAPHRICFRMGWCKAGNDEYNESGLSKWTEPSLKAMLWLLDQHSLVIVLILIPTILVLGILSFFEAILTDPLLCTTIAVCLVAFLIKTRCNEKGKCGLVAGWK